MITLRRMCVIKLSVPTPTSKDMSSDGVSHISELTTLPTTKSYVKTEFEKKNQSFFKTLPTSIGFHSQL